MEKAMPGALESQKMIKPGPDREETSASPTGLRSAILNAALEEFVSAGYHGAGMRTIARQSGASKALLYYHFENKADIYFALLTQCLQDLGCLVDAARAESSVRSQLRILLQGMLTWSPQQRSLITRARQEVVHLDAQRRELFMQQFHRVFIGEIETMLRQGIESGTLRQVDPMMAAQLFFGMAMAPMLPDQQRAADEGHELVDTILDLFLEGLAAERQTHTG